MDASTEKSNQKSAILNLVKLIASYMVVFIHVSFPGKFGTAVICLARFAVPFFFIISGYFSNQEVKKLDKKIQATGLLYFKSIGFYLLVVLVILRDADKFKSWLFGALSKKTILEWVLCNKFYTIELEHLWFIGALLYCYLLMRIIHRYTRLINILPFLLIVNYTFGEWHKLFNLPEFPEYVTRNAWFCGIPCFALGCIIRNQNKIYVEHVLKKISSKVFLVAAVIAEVLVLVEAYLVGIKDLYVSSLAAAVLVFLYGITCQERLPDSWKVLAEINTGTIYIAHQAVAIFLRIIIEKISFKYENVVLPILTCFIVTMISIGIKLCKERISKLIGTSL